MGYSVTKDMEFYRLGIGQSPHMAVLQSAFEDDFFHVAAGEVSYTQAIKTRVVLGKKLYDIIAFNDGVNAVISDKLFVLLKRNKITGWKTYPVSIKGVEQNYHGFQVIGKSGKLIEPKKQNEDDFSYSGLTFDSETWDGSDFFSPAETVARFISPRLRQLLEENKITNIDIENLKEATGYY